MSKIPYTIAIDFDGTLCQNKFPEIGAANDCLISTLIELKKEKPGIRYILWTCRDNNTEEKYLDKAVEFCRQRGLVFDAINENLPEVKELYNNDTRKVFADIYLDDRALTCDYNSFTLLKEVVRNA